MQTTIKGIYDNGQIVLEEIEPSSLQKRPFGSLKGKIGIPDDFNEPLDDLKDYMY